MSESRSKHFRSDGEPKVAMSKGAARSLARRLSTRSERFRAYKCPKCAKADPVRCWHVGHLRWSGRRAA